MRWNPASEHASTRHFMALNRDSKRVWKARLRTARRLGLITPAAEDVGEQLAGYHNGQTGRCDPSRQSLAAAAGYCLRTVANALRRLKEAGMLEWTRRIQATRDGAKQTSSAYRLMLDKPLPKQRQEPEGKACPRTLPFGISELRAVQQHQGAAFDPDAAARLARIRAERTAQLFAGRKPSMA